MFVGPPFLKKQQVFRANLLALRIRLQPRRPPRFPQGWKFRQHAVMVFFPSRRRHTRCSRDWRSDVCSSDLENKLAKHVVIFGDDEHGGSERAQRESFNLHFCSTDAGCAKFFAGFSTGARVTSDEELHLKVIMKLEHRTRTWLGLLLSAVLFTAQGYSAEEKPN